MADLPLEDRIADLEKKLVNEQELRKHYESLLKVHPDTTLPIYREFLMDLDRILDIHGGAEPVPFHLVLIRLDAGYQRIKNTKDRSKAILFRTTVRIREVVGAGLYQSDRLDEFILILRDCSNSGELRKILAGIIREVGLPHAGIAEKLSFGCHIGLATYPDDGDKSSDLLGNAEIALRTALQKKMPVIKFSSRLGDIWHRGLKLEQDLSNASQSGFQDFFMVYQPFVDKGCMIRGCESLIRWNHPELGFIPPPHFIPLAERSGDIRLLGRWILYQSCLQLKAWRQKGHDAFFMSVNLSPAQFSQKDLVKSIAEVLESTGVPGSSIKLEITEGVLLSDPAEVIDKLETLRSMGIRLSIDDFGTGYSSLNYLRRLPLSTLKIDKSFVDHVAENHQDQAIVKAIISMARGLGLDTLAEGVEDKDQLDFLMAEGCDYIQGYYYSKPVKGEEFTAYLDRGGRLP